MKYFIISGEPSGDLHGSNLVTHLIKEDPAAEVVCWGGDRMAAAGAKLLKHYRDLAFMGVWEVMIHLQDISKNFKLCQEQIIEFNPDVVILIDYPGFNLRISRFTKKLGIRTFYYISPKVWAWKESRVKIIKKYIDRLYIIFPFEIEFYRQHGYNAHYIGNPLIDEIESRKKMLSDKAGTLKSLGLGDKPVIALLSGSRNQEVQLILPEMVKIVRDYPGYQFVVTAVSHLPEKMYRDIVGDLPVKIVTDKTYEVLSVAEAALVTSGTATLETAIFGVPQVVCYKTSWLTYHLAKMVIKVDYISLVNLIVDKEIVKELIQGDMNIETVEEHLSPLLKAGDGRAPMLANYASLISLMGGPGASLRIASDIVKSLNKGKCQDI